MKEARMSVLQHVNIVALLAIMTLVIMVLWWNTCFMDQLMNSFSLTVY